MVEMTSAIYRPIYKTWLTIYVCLVLGIIIWIMGTLLDLGSVFATPTGSSPLAFS